MTTIHTRQLQQYTQDNYNNTHYNNTHKTTTTIHTTTIHTRQLQQYTQDNYNNTHKPTRYIAEHQKNNCHNDQVYCPWRSLGTKAIYEKIWRHLILIRLCNAMYIHLILRKGHLKIPKSRFISGFITLDWLTHWNRWEFLGHAVYLASYTRKCGTWSSWRHLTRDDIRQNELKHASRNPIFTARKLTIRPSLRPTLQNHHPVTTSRTTVNISTSYFYVLTPLPYKVVLPMATGTWYFTSWGRHLWTKRCIMHVKKMDSNILAKTYFVGQRGK